MSKRKWINKKPWKLPIDHPFLVSKEPTAEDQIEYTKQLWKDLGIEGTPTKEIIESGKTIEMETVMMIRKYCPYP